MWIGKGQFGLCQERLGEKEGRTPKRKERSSGKGRKKRIVTGGDKMVERRKRALPVDLEVAVKGGKEGPGREKNG